MPTTGIPFVIVNGVVVVRNERVREGVYPGQPIRFPEEAKPRFEELEVEHWRQQYLEAPTGFHGLDREVTESRPETAASMASFTRPTAEGADWLSSGKQIAMPKESHAVFCPVHGVFEQSTGFEPEWMRALAHAYPGTE